MQFKVTCLFNTNKHPDDLNEIHKLKLNLSISTNILDKPKITNNFINTLPFSSSTYISPLLSSHLDFSFSMKTLDILISSSKSRFSKNCSLLSKQSKIFPLPTKFTRSSLLLNVCIGSKIWLSSFCLLWLLPLNYVSLQGCKLFLLEFLGESFIFRQ